MSKTQTAPRAKKRLDAPGTTPEFRAFIDEAYGEDFTVTALGFTKAHIENATNGGKIEVPEEFRPKVAREIAAAEKKAKEDAAREAAEKEAKRLAEVQA